MKRLFLFLVLLLGIQQMAMAELLVEPVVGWSGNQKIDTSPKNYSGGNGLSYGGRLGFQKLGAQVGLDYLQSDISMSSSDFDKNLTTKEWAAFIGYKFPAFFRLYGGYIFSAEGDSKINNADLKLTGGTGFKAGLGFTILPFIDINLEYRKGTYDETKIGGATFDGKGFEATMLSLSLPLTFF